MVICGGEVIEIIHSRFGTQHGDVVATHYFGFATINFAEELAELVPEAQISLIVDDLTVAGSVEEMDKVARFIKESGPEHRCGSWKFHAFKCGSVWRCVWSEKHCFRPSHTNRRKEKRGKANRAFLVLIRAAPGLRYP